MNTQDLIKGLVDKKHPHFQPGDTIRVHIKIKEGEKERIQIFQGIVVARRGGGNEASFVVRKMSFGIGVERIFPEQCASIDKIEVVEQGKVRRSKLFYIRKLKGKSLRIEKDSKERKENQVEEEPKDTSETQSAKAVTTEALEATA